MTDPKPRPISRTLQPALERDEAVPGTVLMTSPLWLSWLAIAGEHAATARHAADQRPAFLSREFRSAMVAITAAAFALDGLYGAVKPLVNPPPSNAPRHRQILELLKLGFQLGGRPHEWLADMDWLDSVRDPAVHHGEQARPPVEHPEIAGLQIAVESSDFTAANAERAVALVVEIARTCFAHPKQATQTWVEQRTPALERILAHTEGLA